MVELIINIHKIDTKQLLKYIAENIESSSQFDEIEKKEPIIYTLIENEDIDDIEELFGRILENIKNK